MPTDKVDSLSENQLEHIILHELTHIRHGDLISNYFICFIQAMFWFNPFVWIAFRQMRRDREAYCDWDVLNGLDTEADRINYGQTVLHFAAMCHTRFDTANGLCQSKSQIKYRLEHIVGFQYETAWKKVAGRCFVCLLVLATSFQIPALAYCSDFSEDYYNLPESLSITQADWSEEFQGADGCGIIYDLNANQYTAYHQDEITRRMPPCSTYKIYSLLNALEQGVITPEENTLLWDGTTYDYAAWNHDQNIDTAMKSSVNWYFERLDDMVGFQQTKAFFQEIGFGSGNPSNDPGSLWNGTGIKISAFEQVELLVKLYRNDFNFAEENITAVKNAMEITSNDTSRLYGKTGTGCADDQNIAGWFIGFVETNDNTYFFAFYLNSSNGVDGEAAYYASSGEVGDGFQIYRIDLKDFSTRLYFSTGSDNMATFWGLLDHEPTVDELLADVGSITSFVVDGNYIYYLQGGRLYKVFRWTGWETVVVPNVEGMRSLEYMSVT